MKPLARRPARFLSSPRVMLPDLILSSWAWMIW